MKKHGVKKIINEKLAEIMSKPIKPHLVKGTNLQEWVRKKKQ